MRMTVMLVRWLTAIYWVACMGMSDNVNLNRLWFAKFEKKSMLTLTCWLQLFYSGVKISNDLQNSSLGKDIFH